MVASLLPLVDKLPDVLIGCEGELHGLAAVHRPGGAMVRVPAHIIERFIQVRQLVLIGGYQAVDDVHARSSRRGIPRRDRFPPGSLVP